MMAKRGYVYRHGAEEGRLRLRYSVDEDCKTPLNVTPREILAAVTERSPVRANPAAGSKVEE